MGNAAQATALRYEQRRPETTPLYRLIATHVERPLDPSQIAVALEAGRFVWIDVDFADPAQAEQVLAELALLNHEIIQDALFAEPATRHARYDEFSYVVVAGCRAEAGGFPLERVDVVIAERSLATIHHGQVQFLSGMRRDYRLDFFRFARSPSFLFTSSGIT